MFIPVVPHQCGCKSRYIGKLSALVFLKSHQAVCKGHPVIYSGWGRGAVGAVDLTPIPAVHALLAQIHLPSKSALDDG